MNPNSRLSMKSIFFGGKRLTAAVIAGKFFSLVCCHQDKLLCAFFRELYAISRAFSSEHYIDRVKSSSHPESFLGGQTEFCSNSFLCIFIKYHCLQLNLPESTSHGVFNSNFALKFLKVSMLLMILGKLNIQYSLDLQAVSTYI